MQKFLFLFAGFFLFCSCNRKKNSNVAIPSPVRECSMQEMTELTGFSFNLPENAEDVSYSVVAGKVAQMDFSWSGCECTARLKKSEKMEDISGLFYSWEKILNEKILSFEAEERYVTDSGGNIHGSCIWYDETNGIAFSFSIFIIGIGPGDTEEVAGLLKKLAVQTYSAPSM